MANGSYIMGHPLKRFPITMDQMYNYFAKLNSRQPHDRSKLLSRSSRDPSKTYDDYWLSSNDKATLKYQYPLLNGWYY